MSGKLEQVVEAVFVVFTDLTSEEAPQKRKAYFTCAPLPQEHHYRLSICVRRYFGDVPRQI